MRVIVSRPAAPRRPVRQVSHRGPTLPVLTALTTGLGIELAAGVSPGWVAILGPLTLTSWRSSPAAGVAGLVLVGLGVLLLVQVLPKVR